MNPRLICDTLEEEDDDEKEPQENNNFGRNQLKEKNLSRKVSQEIGQQWKR